MSEEKFPSQLAERFQIRLPDGMRDRLREEAANSGRSMNAEIVHRLANSLDNPKFSDIAIGLGEELDFALMTAASYSGRSLHEEMVYRLQQSLAPQSTVISLLEDRAWEARSKYDEILKLFLQLTPEERRLLEERVEIVQAAKTHGFTSKQIGDFVRLNPIGNRGRKVLTVPASDYTPLFGKKSLLDAATESQKDGDS